ncbi:MAG TPA: ThiF family adenylyltransferase [Sphingobacteriaceae bacterium]
MPTIDELQANSDNLKNTYKPILLRKIDPADRQALENLHSQNQISFISDQLDSQLKELIKLRHPGQKLTDHESKDLITRHLQGNSIDDYGVWVYYPWNQSLVHLLDEKEFVEVRTNRNQHKITSQELLALSRKKIGIAGLSVGHSIALTLATERTCGELRLADFDDLELSNLNRIRSTVLNLGLPKVILAAREIAEIDPFIKVTIFPEGLQESNMDKFFMEDGPLDLFVEVCDSLDIKINSRMKARTLKIPVVMDTNDRGMLDIERFDLEPERGLFHGLLESFLNADGSITLTEENRRAILMALVSFESLSDRMKFSMTEIGKSITTWPQLASSVVLGGAITTDISRRILLGEHSVSGRYYVDLDAIFGDER